MSYTDESWAKVVLDDHWKRGYPYLIRTSDGGFNAGILERVTDQELVFSHAAWIPDTGRFLARFKNALQSLEFHQIEPYPDTEIIINRQAVITAVALSGLPYKNANHSH